MIRFRRTWTRFSPHRPSWAGRVGQIGFAFFFIKGVAWLILPLALWLIE